MKYIYGCCVGIGLVVMIWAAGASDCGMLDFGQAALGGICGLAIFIGGMIGIKCIESKEG